MWKTQLVLGTFGGVGLSDEEQIALFRRTGFDGFFLNWTDADAVRRCREEADRQGMLFQSVHAPYSGAKQMWQEGAEGEIFTRELCRCAAACGENGVPLMVCHAYIGFDNEDRETAAGIRNYGAVIAAAEKAGIRVAFENTEGEGCLDALLRRFADHPSVGFCWDTGHEKCYNRGRDLMASYGDRLFGTHFNDNLGISRADGTTFWTDDLHLLPFDGITDWESVAKKLAGAGFCDPLTFELTTKSKPDRHENDLYAAMPFEVYLGQAYARACRVAALVQREQQQN